jgi:hypothetical protein
MYRNIIINSRIKVFSVRYFKHHRRPKHFLLDGTSEEECDRKLDPKAYPGVKSWTKKEWHQQYPKGTSAISGPSGIPFRGSGRMMVQDINVLTCRTRAVSLFQLLFSGQGYQKPYAVELSRT